MARYNKTSRSFVSSMPAIPSDASKSLQAYLRNLGELIESKIGTRGNALDRHVTVRELQDAGVIDRIDQSAIYRPGAVNAQNRGFTNTGTMSMFKSPREKSYQSSTHTFTHFLGRVPDFVQLVAHCTATGDGTFEVGDVVALPNSLVETEGNNEGCTVEITSSKIKVFAAANGIGVVVKKDGTGGLVVLNNQTEANSRWDIEVKAFVFEEST